MNGCFNYDKFVRGPALRKDGLDAHVDLSRAVFGTDITAEIQRGPDRGTTRVVNAQCGRLVDSRGTPV